jgi:hypothetical protein
MGTQFSVKDRKTVGINDESPCVFASEAKTPCYGSCVRTYRTGIPIIYTALPNPTFVN